MSVRDCVCGGGVWAKVLGCLVCLLLFQAVCAGELKVLRVLASGEDSLLLLTDSQTHLDLNLISKVSLEPAVPGLRARHTLSRGAVFLEGNFRPGRPYLVRLQPGIADVNGDSTSQHYLFRVTFSERDTRLRPTVSGAILPLRRDNWTLPVEITNADTLQLTAYTLSRDNLVAYDLDNFHTLATLHSGANERSYTVRITRNERANAAISLTDIIPQGKPGRYLLMLTAVDKGDRPAADGAWDGRDRTSSDLVHVIVTDLGLTLCSDRDGRQLLVSVQHLDDRRPAASADILVYSRTNRLLAKAKTDQNGCARLAYDPFADADGTPRLVLAQLGDDLSLIELQNHLDGSNPFFDAHPVGEANEGRTLTDKPDAFLYFERGVARPGETVTASAFLRRRLPDRYETLRDFPCVLTLRDSADNVIGLAKLKSDRHGFVTRSFALSPSMRTGRVTATLSIDGGATLGNASLQVATYIPDRLKVSMRLNPARAQMGSPLAAVVSAAYNHGGSADGLKLKTRFWLEPADTPRHWEGFTVGDMDGWTPWGQQRDADARLDGEATVPYTWPELPQQENPGTAPLALHAEATVVEPGGRAVTARANALCETSPWYLGLAAADADGRQPVLRYRALTTDPKERPDCGSAEVRLQLHAVSWQSVVVMRNGVCQRQWERVVEPYGEPLTLTLAGTDGEWRLPELPSGGYEAVATVGERIRTRLAFWHWYGETGQRVKDPSQLTFRLDRSSYLPGDEARITFEAAASGWAVWSAGEAGLELSGTQPVTAGENTLVIRIPQTVLTQRFLCGVTLLAGPGEENRQFGVAALPVRQDRHRLNVTVTAPEIARPGQDARLQVALADADGKPAAGLAHVFLVDSGVLSLTAYRTPDIFAHFHSRRRSRMEWRDNYGAIYPDVLLKDAIRIGGDADLGAVLRTPLDLPASAVIVLPPVEVDASGRADLTVAMPELLGSMRVMCVAANEESCGSGWTTAIVREEVDVLASAPRAVAPGDEFDLTFDLNNFDAPEGDFAFAVTLPSALAPAADDAPTATRGRLAKGGRQTVRLRVRALEQLGAFEVAYRLTLGAAAKTGRLKLNVRSANPPTEMMSVMSLAPGETRTLTLSAANWLAGTASGKVTVSPGPITGLTEALEWLNDYPYGCLEQTVSQAFPFLWLREMTQAGLISDLEAKTYAGRLDAALARILDMHLGRGRFALWPGLDRPHDDATLYAIHFIFELARRREVDATLLRTLENRLADCFGSLSDTRPAHVAYAAYILSLRAGEHGQNAELAAAAAQTLLRNDAGNSMAAFLAAAALVNSGHAAEAMPRLRACIAGQAWRDEDGSRPLAMSDSVSQTGMALAMLSDILPQDEAVTRLAVQLDALRRTDGRAWGTPQTNAWAVVGLSCFAARAAGQGDWTPKGTARLDGADPVPLDGARLRSWSLRQGQRLELTNAGERPLFVSFRQLGVRRAPMRPERGALALSRRYLDASGKPASSFRAGDLITVELTISSLCNVSDVVVADMLPGGLEIEDDGLTTRARAIRESDRKTDGGSPFETLYIDRRDDRCLLFGNFTARGTHTFRYAVRAVTAGRFAAAPAIAEAMYAPDLRAVFAQEDVLTVE